MLGDGCRQSLGQGVDPVAAAHFARHRFHLFVGGLWGAVADVVGHRPRKEEGRLWHNAQPPPIVAQIEGADVTVVDEQPPALELVEARHQLAQARLPRAGVAHQRNGLPGRDDQAEVFEHGLLLGVAEIHLLKLDASLQRGDRLIVALYHLRLGIHQRKDTFTGRHAQLELAPKRSDAGEREPEEVDALHKEEPRPRRHHTRQHAAPAKVEDQRRADPRHSAEDGKDGAEDQPLPPTQPIRLRIHPCKFVVDRLFLAEVFGDGNAGNRFLHVGVHLRDDTPRLLCRVAGDAAESERDDDDQRCNRQRDEGQLHVDEDEDRHHHRHLEHLADQVERQGDHVGKILRVRRDATDDLARRELIVERHVTRQDGVEGVPAQIEHHVAHGAGGVALTHKVECPREHAGEEDGHNQPPTALPYVDADVVAAGEHVQPRGNEHREGRIHQRVEHNHPAHQQHLSSIGFEIAPNAPQQLAIRITAVVCLGIETVHDEAHVFPP